jgi:hypothetical protein
VFSPGGCTGATPPASTAIPTPTTAVGTTSTRAAGG